ncbi:hypothetical protein WDL1CHR_05263 [Variovorax sp. WDL1]|nr:hypothetical protein CHC06_07289 [Variovorax sp. B2]PNG48403.1 hypothetical protein CHC07_07579 [Variovorax sp. B4]VTV14784.1 hypothetical protein WDL1CHR_05263 [Variovorax sp. WDL1]
MGMSSWSSLTMTRAHTHTHTHMPVLVLVPVLVPVLVLVLVLVLVPVLVLVLVPVLVLVLVLRFVHVRKHLFQASRSEAVVGRAKQRPVHIPSARAEERSFSRIRAARV